LLAIVALLLAGDVLASASRTQFGSTPSVCDDQQRTRSSFEANWPMPNLTPDVGAELLNRDEAAENWDAKYPLAPPLA
jgi:hypothetical protein